MLQRTFDLLYLKEGKEKQKKSREHSFYNKKKKKTEQGA